MNAERRYNNRHPVDFPVEIRYRGRRFTIARAHNISPEGIYLQTCSLTLPRDTPLELEIFRWGREWLIPAVVIHSDIRGVGLMFREAQSELYDREAAALAEPMDPYRIPEAAANRTGL